MTRLVWFAGWSAWAWAGLISAASSAEVVPVIGLAATAPESGPSVKTEQGFMVPYTAKIPGSTVTFTMVPIAGGTFTLGSPESEEGRHADEGPPHKISIPPFWIGKYEVTWDEYRTYMSMYEAFKELEGRQLRLVNETNLIDAVTAPTPLYEPDFTFELGDKGRQPAVTMSQFAAKQYTKWLSGITGQFYRLPCEAEWEYACRAGSQTKYSFGDDATQLDEYAWYSPNSDEAYHEVGQKKPNAWGLYDMHGNVAELCLDQYDEKAYTKLADGVAGIPDAIQWGNKPFPHVIRGGGWDHNADELRSAARSKTKDWRDEDPNLPKSPWWFTDQPARTVGMRIVRPLTAPTDNNRAPYWEAESQVIQDAVENRNLNGRGAIGLVDEQLPQAIQELHQK